MYSQMGEINTKNFNDQHGCFGNICGTASLWILMKLALLHQNTFRLFEALHSFKLLGEKYIGIETYRLLSQQASLDLGRTALAVPACNMPWGTPSMMQGVSSAQATPGRKLHSYQWMRPNCVKPRFPNDEPFRKRKLLPKAPNSLSGSPFEESEESLCCHSRLHALPASCWEAPSAEFATGLWMQNDSVNKNKKTIENRLFMCWDEEHVTQV